LQPFFSTQGETPWGEVIEAAKTNSELPVIVERKDGELGGPTIATNKTKTTTGSSNKLRQELGAKLKPNDSTPTDAEGPHILVHDGVDDELFDDDVDVVLTDRQITARKTAEHVREQQLLKQYQADTKFIQEWVQKLPNPTGFKIQNVNEIMAKHFGSTY